MKDYGKETLGPTGQFKKEDGKPGFSDADRKEKQIYLDLTKFLRAHPMVSKSDEFTETVTDNLDN